MTCVDEKKLLKIVAALFVVAVCPSFFFQKMGKRICSAMTYFNGGVVGLTALTQEPLVLAINPILAIVGISITSLQKAKLYE